MSRTLLRLDECIAQNGFRAAGPDWLEMVSVSAALRVRRRLESPLLRALKNSIPMTALSVAVDQATLSMGEGNLCR